MTIIFWDKKSTKNDVEILPSFFKKVVLLHKNMATILVTLFSVASASGHFWRFLDHGQFLMDFRLVYKSQRYKQQKQDFFLQILFSQ